MTNTFASECPPAGLVRRLVVLVYESLVLVAVLFLAGFLALPLAQGEAIVARQPLFRVYLLAVVFLYLGWFWTHGGQTVAMRAWRLRLVDDAGHLVGWGRAALRFVAALLPTAPALLWMSSAPDQAVSLQLTLLFGCWLCGFLWVAVDAQKRAWHDILSDTRVVLVPPAREPARKLD